MTGCSYLDSEECRECYYFPICNGGCHRIRQKNLYTDKPHSPCSYFRDNLEELLELHYENKLEMVARMRARQKAQEEAQKAAAVQGEEK